jgi:hypothetical protein
MYKNEGLMNVYAWDKEKIIILISM